MYVTLEYQFSTSTTEPPTGSQIRLNGVQSGATLAWIRSEAANGLDTHTALTALTAEDKLILNDWDDSSVNQHYIVTGDPTDKGDYVEVPIAWSNGTTDLAAQKVLLTLYRVPDPGLPAGGDSGTHLAKTTGADFDVAWVDPDTGSTDSTTTGGCYAPYPWPDNPPDLAAVKEWLGIDPADTQDDDLLSTSLDAALQAQAMIVTYPCDATDTPVWSRDLYDAALLRTQRLAARRNSPEAIVGLTGTTGDFVSARLTSTDPDVMRLEGPWLAMVVS